MRKLVFGLAACVVVGLSQAAVAAPAKLPPVRIVLVGDSTQAHKSGYGDAFCAQFKPEVTCINGGRGGRSTKSYRVDGIWDKDIMSELQKPNAPDGTPYARTYVLMQFGHNDGSPKPERHTDVLWEFPANLSAYAKEAKATGAVFILVTPLTMRDFVDGQLLPDRVAPFAASMHNVAITDHLPLIDLFAESQKAVQAMGLVKANHTLAGGPIPQNVLDTENTGTSVPPKVDMSQTDASQTGEKSQPFDYTHLNQTTGADFFGSMVADLLIRNQPDLAAYRKPK
jgi:lysophospholipase L1-like esterase